MKVEDALVIARDYIAKNIPPSSNGGKFVIVLDGVAEDEDGWFFPYQTEKFLEIKDMQFSVVGNWPVFVSKDGCIELRRFGAPFSPRPKE
ncbi:YrhB domain-containing protein [Chromobacterium sp. TRC.1.1.SA]|uniref:YrhB domain-containing protein n=1 Tax=Chromobacterium indicum TaxID=3110228 RepID=A0ABV0CLN0_9NEIS